MCHGQVILDVYVKNDEIPKSHFWGIMCDRQMDAQDRFQYSPLVGQRETIYIYISHWVWHRNVVLYLSRARVLCWWSLVTVYTCYQLSMSHLVLWPFGIGEFYPYSSCQIANPQLPRLFATCFILVNKLRGNHWTNLTESHKQGVVWDGHRLIRF